MNKKKDLLFSFFIKSIASFFVVINHTMFKNIDLNVVSRDTNIFIAFFTLCKIAVPLFLMISGFYALRDTKKMSLRDSMKDFLDFFLLFFVGTVSYYFMFLRSSNVSLMQSLYATNVTNIYWYMFLYLGILLMLPIFRIISQNATNKEILYIIIVTLLFESAIPMLLLIFKQQPISVYFTSVLLKMPVAYLFLGHFIWRVKDKLSKNFKVLIGSGVFSFILWFIFILLMKSYLNDGKDMLFWDNRYWLHIVLLSTAIFIFIYSLSSYIELKVDKKIFELFSFLSRATLYVFLFSDHILKVFEMLKIDEILNYVFKTQAISNVFLAIFVWANSLFLGIVMDFLINIIKKQFQIKNKR